MQENKELLGSLFEKDIDYLYLEIGRELYGSAAFPPSTKQIGQIARIWLEKKHNEIAKVVCGNKSVTTLISKDDNPQDRIVLVTAVADLIASIVIGVSPITVAVLLVKEGLKTLCDKAKGK